MLVYSFQGGNGEIHVDDNPGGSPQCIPGGEFLYEPVQFILSSYASQSLHDMFKVRP